MTLSNKNIHCLCYADIFRSQKLSFATAKDAHTCAVLMKEQIVKKYCS
jgi:hypothetical protein